MQSFPSAVRAAGVIAAVAVGVVAAASRNGTAQKPAPASATAPADEFAATTRPLLAKYCLGCHSTKAKKGHLDLERFATPADARNDLKVWQGVVEQLEAGEM